MTTEKLAEILCQDLTLDSLREYLKQEQKTVENCKKYGRSTKTSEIRVKAAKLAIELKCNSF